MSNFPRVVQDYVERRFNELDRKRRKRFSRISSKQEMQAFVDRCRKKIRSLFALPKHKTNLRTAVTGELKCDGYRIEKIVFESRPRFQLTANLYIP
jgi:hypothetical protein